MRTADELRDLLEATWADLERTGTPADPEGLGLVLVAPTWDLQPLRRHADELLDAVVDRGGVVAAELLLAIAAFGPRWVAEPARGSLDALLGAQVAPRWPAAIGSLTPSDALTLVGHDMRVHLVRLVRPGWDEQRLFTVLEHRSPLQDPVLRGGLQDPAPAEELDAIVGELVRGFDPWAVQSVDTGRMAYRLELAFRGAHDAGLAMSEELSLTAPLLARALCGDPGAWPRLAIMAEPSDGALAGLRLEDGAGAGIARLSRALPSARRREHRAAKALRRRGRRPRGRG